MLERSGYTVLDAADGALALEIAARHHGPIHLVVTDVVMPAMGGRQMSEQLTRHRPDTKVLYTSGYTDDAIVRHGVLEAGVPFLQKPFTPEALVRKVREVLDKPRR
jgi:CheY-like chemotaxis protein